MDVLTLHHLTKRYERFTLDDVSFSVRQGEIMGFIGRNGAGKTTTLKCMLNLVHPDGGDMSFFGLPFQEHELEIRRRLGFVTGGVDFYPRKKLRTITSVTRAFYAGAWDQAAYEHCIALFSLDESKTPSQLSAGMRVKYNLALALSHRAELLVLDEPTSGLDPVSRDDLLDVFLALQKQGVSILFSTHITEDLDKCADRITYIRGGRIVLSEELSAFAGQYRAVELQEGDVTEALRPHLIGLKPAKRGYTALVKAADAAVLAIPTLPADLDTIMVHLEKEGA